MASNYKPAPVLIIILFLIAAAFILNGRPRETPVQATKPQQQVRWQKTPQTLTPVDYAAQMDSNPPENLAHAVCLVAVKHNLKAPSTAEFQNSNDDLVKYVTKEIWASTSSRKPRPVGTFYIQTQVDAQNSFSAMIRTTFTCVVQCRDSENCKVSELKSE